MPNFITKIAALLASLAFAIGLAAAPTAAFAAKPETYTGLLGNTAVGGYDAVSYFAGAPLKGMAAHQVTYKGAIYNFATADNAVKFKANPAAYAPHMAAIALGLRRKERPRPGTRNSGNS